MGERRRTVRSHASGPRHLIRDRKALASLIRELIQEHAGGVLKAERETGISRASWNRLLGCQCRAISQSLGSHLQRLILLHMGDAGNRRFLNAMTMPGTVPAIRRYWAWALERQQRLWQRRGKLWRRLPDGSIVAVKGKDSRRRARMAYARGLDLKIEGEVRQYVEFKQWLKDHFIDQHRVTLALMRILEPFLEAPESGFIEMTWDEAPAAGRRECVREAVRRERWLLQRRGPAQQRAERVATRAM